MQCRITNAVKCLPRKTSRSQERYANAIVISQLKFLILCEGRGIALLALGAIAHQAALMALGLKPGDLSFRSWRRSCIAFIGPLIRQKA